MNWIVIYPYWKHRSNGGDRVNEVLRQEKKFLITLDQYYRYAPRFAKIMSEDAHNHGDGYTIRSLYFDTIDDRDFQEKEDGIEIRRKLRLRNYGANSATAKLEMKQKQGANQKKRSLTLSKEDACALIDGHTSVLLKEGSNFALECYAMMNMHVYRPISVVEYKRRAFIAKENNIRITFDHHIIASESNYAIFDSTLKQNSVFEPYLVVLEVKYNGFLLSYIKDMVDEIDRSETSVSKYCLSRTISKHFVY